MMRGVLLYFLIAVSSAWCLFARADEGPDSSFWAKQTSRYLAGEFDSFLYRYLTVYLQKPASSSNAASSVSYVKLPIKQQALQRLSYFTEAADLPAQMTTPSSASFAKMGLKGSNFVLFLPREPQAPVELWLVQQTQAEKIVLPPYSVRPLTLPPLHRWFVSALGFDGVLVDCQGDLCLAAVDARFAKVKTQASVVPGASAVAILNRVALGQKSGGGHIIEVVSVPMPFRGLAQVKVVFPPLSDKPLEARGAKLIFDQSIVSQTSASLKLSSSSLVPPPAAGSSSTLAVPRGEEPPAAAPKGVSMPSPVSTSEPKKSTRVVRITKAKAPLLLATIHGGYALLRSLNDSRETLKGFVVGGGALFPLGQDQTLLPYFKADISKENISYSGTSHMTFDWLQVGLGLGIRHFWNQAQTWSGYLEGQGRVGFAAAQQYRQVDGTAVDVALSNLWAASGSLGFWYGAGTWQLRSGIQGVLGTFQRPIAGIPTSFRYGTLQVVPLQLCYRF